MATEEHVETVFSVVDKATAPLRQISAETKKLAQQAKETMEAARAAEKAFEFKHGSAGQIAQLSQRQLIRQRIVDAGGMSLEQATAGRAEMLMQRENRRATMLNIERQRIAGELSFRAAEALGVGTSEVTAHMGRFGMVLDMAGLQLSQFGGEAAVAGSKLARVGAFVNAFTAGYQIGTWLDEHGLNPVEEVLNPFGGAKDAIERINQENMAKAAGFRSSKERWEYRGQEMALGRDITLDLALKKHASQLGALPFNASKQSMEALSRAELDAALAIRRETGTTLGLDELIKDLKERQATNLSSQAAKYGAQEQQEIILQHAAATYAEMLGRVPINGTLEEMMKFNEKVSSTAFMLTSFMHSLGFADVSLADVAKALKGGADNALQNMVNSELKKNQLDDRVAFDARQHGNIMRHMSEKTQADRDKKLAFQAADMAREYAKLTAEYGRAPTPETMQKYAQETLQRAYRGAPTINQDFRGSQFDIKQQFADIDPGRVGVAFANDLAALGERQLQSGFAPLFAVR
jgi:hypothetical protein